MRLSAGAPRETRCPLIADAGPRVGDLTLDVAARLLIRDSELVTLPPKTFELLVALVRRAPGVVSRRELMDSVWIDELVNDEALTQRVMLLRRALGDDSKTPRYIASVPRWGYRIVAPVQALAREEGATAAAVGQAPATIKRRVGVALAVGDRNQAFEWLFRAIGEPSSLVASLKVEPAIDPLRDDSRFDELIRKLGLDG